VEVYDYVNTSWIVTASRLRRALQAQPPLLLSIRSIIRHGRLASVANTWRGSGDLAPRFLVAARPTSTVALAPVWSFDVALAAIRVSVQTPSDCSQHVDQWPMYRSVTRTGSHYGCGDSNICRQTVRSGHRTSGDHHCPPQRNLGCNPEHSPGLNQSGGASELIAGATTVGCRPCGLDRAARRHAHDHLTPLDICGNSSTCTQSLPGRWDRPRRLIPISRHRCVVLLERAGDFYRNGDGHCS